MSYDSSKLQVCRLAWHLFSRKEGNRGRWPVYDDHTDDELISQRTTVLGNGFGPDDRRYRRVVVESRRLARGSSCPATGPTTMSPPASAVARSATGPWPGGSCRRTSSCDRPTAAPDGSTVDDWPISYDDLEPCYEKAEWEVGVSGDDTREPVCPAPQEAAADARLPLQQGGRDPGGGGEAAGLASLSHPDAFAIRSPTAAGRRVCTCATASVSPAPSMPRTARRTR